MRIFQFGILSALGIVSSLLALLAIVVGNWYFRDKMEEARALVPEIRQCAIEGPSVVWVSGQPFKIPAKTLGAYIWGNGQETRTPKSGKYRSYADYKFRWRICPAEPGTDHVRRKLEFYGPPVDQISHKYLPFAANIRIQVASRNRAGNSAVRRSRIPNSAELIDGFWQWDNQDGDYIFLVDVTRFIPAGAQFPTPLNDGLTFTCRHEWFGLQYGECSTYFYISDDVQVSYSFAYDDYPKENWRELHGDITSFVNALRI